MKKTLLLILTILAFTQVNAQFIKKRSIDISIGYGVSYPYDDLEIYGDGFFLQGEYVMEVSKWIDIRPYAGVIFTKSNGEDLNQNPTIYIATTNAFLLGGKTRITIPIPWVSPYVEVGIGGSIGSFETFTPFTNIEKKGFTPHIPVSIGLELGPKHNFDIEFTYYYQPNLEQFAGAAAFGVSIPID